MMFYFISFGGWGWVAASKQLAAKHFKLPQATLHHLGLIQANHKASPPSQCMVWLALEFNSVVMTITIPQPKLAEIAVLVAEWTTMSCATLHQPRVLHGKLLTISLSCVSSRFSLTVCSLPQDPAPPPGSTALSS